jgi:hypothetical protein
MAQLHPENDYVVVEEIEVVDLVIIIRTAQARAQDPVTLERPFSRIYSILKEFKTRVE